MEKTLRFLFACAAASIAAVGPARAQTGPYTNTSNGNINAGTTCASPLIRTISVPDSFTIGDVDVGFIARHSWRTDIQVQLTSPAGTTVEIMDGPADQNINHYNIRLDDEATTFLNVAPHNTDDNVNATPYENTVRPDNLLSGFDGEDALGTWTFAICDTFPGSDNGQFRQAELFFEVASDADLSLAMTVDDATPSIGDTITYTLTATNAGPLAVSGVSVESILPTGVSYVSDNGGGAYNSASGLWTAPGTIAVGASASLQISALVNASGDYASIAEIIAASLSDPDSTPDNRNSAPLEDDTATVTIFPGGAPGSPPTLTCPSGAATHDWDSNTWPTGSLAQTYSGGAQTLDFSISGDTGFIQTGSPETNQDTTGGLSPAENGLYMLLNYGTSADSIDVAFDIGVTGTGVDGLQFSIFDVDLFGGQFTDQLNIVGYLNGVVVAPVLTNGVANTTSGFTATGIALADNATADGTVVITFTDPVDQVVITYGSGASAPSAPGNQAIAVHDITYCNPSAVLTASKTVTVYDPGAAGLLAVPGNEVIYAITATNIGDGAVDSDTIYLVDALPGEVEFYNGDFDNGGPGSGAIEFSQSSAGLSLTEASDVAYSNAGSAPASFAACTYSPSAGYDPAVTFVCFNPKGAMAAGSPDPSFTVRFRARIK